jgi:hypothetical protein
MIKLSGSLLDIFLAFDNANLNDKSLADSFFLGVSSISGVRVEKFFMYFLSSLDL